MPREQNEERLIDGKRANGSSVVTGDAGDQPGACPLLDGEPARSELPTDAATNEPVALIYVNTATEAVEIASPDGNGGVSIGVVVDLSANVSLSTGDSGGLL